MKLLNLIHYHYMLNQRLKLKNFLINSFNNDSSITILRFATAFGLSPRMRYDLTVNEFVREAFSKNI